MAELRIGIDTGGTFTDVAVLDRGALRIHKLASTPDDPARAVLAGIDAVRDARPVDVVHGTTVGLNAVLVGNLARTALVTNAGFEDLVEIGRQDRLGLYDLEPRRARVPVPRGLRLAIAQRRHADGTLERTPTAAELRELAVALRTLQIDAVAIGLLHSPAYPEDERAIATALESLDIPVTCSAELLPRSGEFERFSAAILNAAIQPVMGSYLARLGTTVEPGRLRLLRSSGGIMGTAEARRFPARAMFSGPAGGVIATARIAVMRGEPRLAAIDIGGTSTDAALVGPDPQPDDEDRAIAGLPLPLPSFDVHTVGCGGGSIAWVDTGGALRVGPMSAGADPGPACYGRGWEPTLTDAHVALGHIGADTLLGGKLTIDPDRAVRAIESLATRLGMSPRATARGILEVADIAMVRALLVITSERAVDPATVPLLAYGGAGGLHAASLARRLSMPYALVPPVPGAFSAVGLALAGESDEQILPVLRRLDRECLRGLPGLARQLAASARARLEGRGRAHLRADARLRFVGQGMGLWTPLGPRLEQRFRALHTGRYGFDVQGAAVEVVDLRVQARRTGPCIAGFPVPGLPARKLSPVLLRPPLGGTPLRSWRRDELGLGIRLAGPGLIVETTSVVRIPDGAQLWVDPAGLRMVPDATGRRKSRPTATTSGGGRSGR